MSNYTLWGLFGPATWPWWLAVLAWLSFYSRFRRQAPRLVGLAVAAFVVLAILPTGYWLAEPLERRFPPPTELPRDVRHIVVLAGAEQLAASARSGRPEVGAAAERIIEGAALARARSDATLWIVGGVRHARSARADIDWTALTWQRLGVPAASIRRIDGTRDTCANARGVAARQLKGRILLVTSALHMPRAVACFRAARVAALPYPVDYLNEPRPSVFGPFGPSLAGRMLQADAALHEWIGLTWYRLRGRSEVLYPAP